MFKYIILSISCALIYMATKTYYSYINPLDMEINLNKNTPLIVKKRETNYIFKNFKLKMIDKNNVSVEYYVDIKSKYVNFKNIHGEMIGSLFFTRGKVYILPEKTRIQDNIKNLPNFLKKYISYDKVNVSPERIIGPLTMAFDGTAIYELDISKANYFDKTKITYENEEIVLTRQFLIGYSGFGGIIIFLILLIKPTKRKKNYEGFNFNF